MDTINRRDFLEIIGVGGATIGLSGMSFLTGCSQATRQPNILFIMVDDLGKEWISCCGAEEISTPNIDRLARTGMRFTNAYSMAQCTPTRATLLTGQYPWRHGWVNHWDVPRWGAGCHFDWKHNMTFARLMKKAGYVTAAAGKWQINDFRITPDAMEKHGFDEYCMWTGYETGNPPSAKRYWDPYIHTKAGSRTYKGQFGPDIYTDFLIDFMSRHKNEPMMLYFPMALSHGPLVATPLEPNVQGRKETHAAMVRYIDHLVGQLVRSLDELGLREDTIIIFTTDNGSAGSQTARMNGRSVRGGKATLGEPGVNMPFIVNCPGRVPQGVVTDAPTDFTDLLPTFAELGGVDIPEDVVVDGRSIANVILGEQQDSSRDWIMAMGFWPARLTADGVEPYFDFGSRVVRNERYKLWVDTQGQSIKLFDLKADPAEANNLIGSTDPELRFVREQLEAVIQSFPKKDAKPKYDPTPPQLWDMTVAKMDQLLKRNYRK